METLYKLRISDNLKAVTANLGKLGQRLQQTFQKDGVGLAGRFGQSIEQATAKIRKMQQELAKAGSKMQSAGQQMSMFITAPLAGAGALTVRAAANFEEAMNGVRAVTQTTGSTFDALSAKAKQLGATTQFSATEAAGGIEMLARNGLKADDILNGALDATLLLASATGTNLANAANIATDVMAAFNVKAADMGAVVDKISGVTLNSKFSIDDYAQALAQGGGVAASVGVTLDDFNASIAAISPLFQSGSDAGTSFKTFLQRLSPQTEEAADLMKKLGIDFFNANGSMKSMNEIAGILQGTFAGMTEEQKINTATTLFGSDAMRAAFGLAKAGSGEMQRLSASINQVSAATQAQDRMRGFNGALKQLKSAIEGLQISIAESGLLGFLTNLVQKITAFVGQLTAASPETKRFAVVVTALVAALGPGITIAGKILSTFSPMVSLFKTLGLVLAPITLEIAAIIAIAGGLILLGKSIYDTWEPVQTFFKDLFDNIASIFQGAIKWLSDKWVAFLDFLGIESTGFTEDLAKLWDAGLKKLDNLSASVGMEELWGNIKKNFNGFVELAKETGQEMGHYLSGDFMAQYATGGGQKPKVDGPFNEDGTIGQRGVSGPQAAPLNLPPLNVLQDTQKGIDGITASTQKMGTAFEQVGQNMAVSILQTTTAMIEGTMSTIEAVRSIVKAFVAEAVAAIIVGSIKANSFLGPAAIPIAAAAGAAVSALAAKAIPAFADGGIVYGPTVGLMGEYAGARTNPEVIAPLDKLQSIMQGAGQSDRAVRLDADIQLGQPTVKVKGQDLVMAFERAKLNERDAFGKNTVYRT